MSKMRVTDVEIAETKNGDPYKKMTLSNGATVGVFNRNSRYSDIEEGLELSEDDFHQKGKWINLTDPENGRPKGAKDPDFDSQVAEADAQQSRREHSIKLTSTMRMAVDMVVSKNEVGAYERVDDEYLQKQIGKWRNWFYNEWENIAGEEPITPDEIPWEDED